uniref:NfeD family protein n=1 Tax=Vibrio alfacsensis TaxID=1074311 RepID=UPI0013E3DAB0|nr:NfeD family protein [Vibrio alfacsensis]
MIPDQVVEILIAITVSTALVSFVLYPFLKRLQNARPTSEVESDFANIEFVLESATEQGEPPRYHYSGIDWRLRSEEPIVAGIKVRVVKKEVGVFWIEPVA